MSLKTKIAIAITVVGTVVIYALGFILSSVTRKTNPDAANNYFIISQYVVIGFLVVMAIILTLFIQMDVHKRR